MPASRLRCRVSYEPMETIADKKATPRAPFLVQAAGLALLALGFVLIHFAPGHIAAASVRWAGLVILAFVALRRRSLTSWIFLSMIVGLEIGIDWPGFAVQLKLLSDI